MDQEFFPSMQEFIDAAKKLPVSIRDFLTAPKIAENCSARLPKETVYSTSWGLAFSLYFINKDKMV